MTVRLYLLLAIGTAVLATAMLGGLIAWTGRPELAERMSFVMERKTAASIARGQAVILPSGLNEWMLRWKLASRLTKAPEVAVLGSSHSLGVTASLLGAEHTMNFSISGSSLADHLVTTSILEARAIRPKRWVVFVNAWWFDLGADYGAWYHRVDDLLRMEANLSARGPALEPVFSTNESVLARGQKGNYALEPLLLTIDGMFLEYLSKAQSPRAGHDGLVITADGALAVSSDKVPLSLAAVAALTQRQFLERPDRHRYGTYGQVDENLWSYFERWVQACQQNGSEVWLVLSPYHPAIYPSIVQSTRNQLRTVEGRVRDFGRRTSTPVIGSYDPTRAQILAEWFYDGDHLREDGLRSLLAPFRSTGAAPLP